MNMDQQVVIKDKESVESIPDFSIVLVCWNNKDYLGPCLDSLYGGAVRSTFDVVVVDNGSTDGSLALLREKYPEVKIVQNDHNVGLSKASNQGIVATHGRNVLLLNNDTLINGASLDSMAKYLSENSDAGAVGGQLINPDGSFQAAGSKFPSLHEEFLITTRLGALFWPSYPDITPPKGVTAVNWLGSACLMIRRDVLDKVGLLDEQYFIYGDEADLQYRIKKNGWKVYYLPDVMTIHYGGRSMDRWKRRKMVYRGKMLFFQKNYGPVPEFALRVMLAGLSMSKLAFWKIATLFASKRDVANKEIKSNLEVIKLCWKLE